MFSRSFFPKFPQGPFPKIAGKSPASTPCIYTVCATGSNIFCKFPAIVHFYLDQILLPCVNGHSKIDKTKILMTNGIGSLIEVESITECYS